MVLSSGSKSWWLRVHNSYSYSIQLLMRPTLKVLKYVNCHLCSSQKFTNETWKTLYDHFDAVYASLTLSSLLSTLDHTHSYIVNSFWIRFLYNKKVAYLSCSLPHLNPKQFAQCMLETVAGLEAPVEFNIITWIPLVLRTPIGYQWSHSISRQVI